MQRIEARPGALILWTESDYLDYLQLMIRREFGSGLEVFCQTRERNAGGQPDWWHIRSLPIEEVNGETHYRTKPDSSEAK